MLEGSGVGTRGHAMQGGPDGVCGAPRLAALMAGRKSRALGAEESTPVVTPCLCPGSASTADRLEGWGWLSCPDGSLAEGGYKPPGILMGNHMVPVKKC